MSCSGLALEVRLNTCELNGMEVPNFTNYLIKSLPIVGECKRRINVPVLDGNNGLTFVLVGLLFIVLQISLRLINSSW